MKRRTLLAALAAATAGCTGSGGNDGGDGEEPTDDETTAGDETDTEPAESSIRSREFERRDACSERGSATISTDGDAVVVTGCITGEDGCKVAVLEEATYDGGADELRVVVGTEDGTESGACTQALTSLGYRCRVVFDGQRPATTVAVHDGAGGASTVAEAETR
ncbi:MAG: hypothetical protein ABEJ79_03065 [Halolamina sp.]